MPPEKLKMRVLKSIVALIALAIIAGQACTGQRAAITPKDLWQQFPSNSAPAQILLKECGNCHSNRTEWPWYSHVAPVSWWIARDVSEGRKKLDFSQWPTYSARQKRDKLESVCGLISTGRMPPRLYKVMHPEATLSEKDKQAVCAWAKAQPSAQR